MRTKILLFPLLLLVIIATLVWMIVPTWDEIKIKKADLEKREAQLKEVQEKNAIVDNLISIYKSKEEERNLIYEFIPTKINDEEIINNLIYYANAQGGEGALGVSNITVSKATKTAKTNENSLASQANIGELMKAGGSGNIGSKMLIGTVPAEPVSLGVNLTFSGKYAGIKSYFNKLATLKRGNSVSIFKISRVGEEEGNSDLMVDATLNFSYLEEYNPLKVDGTALGNNLKINIAQEVKNKLNAEVVKVQFDSTVKDNPFTP